MSAIHAARSLYESMPLPVRSMIGPPARILPARLRYGSAFADTQALLAARARGELDEAAEVARRLERLHAAAMRTPFWRDRLEGAGLASEIENPEALLALPTLAKDEVRASHQRMVDPSSPPSARKWVTTGGTSGAQLGLWIDRDASAADWAFVTDAWSRVGFRLDERRVVFRGVIGGTTRSLFRYEPIRRELYVSVFDLDEAALFAVRARLRSFAPRFLHGYPSVMETLAKSYLAAGETPPRFEALLCVSEMVYPHQRELFDRVFGCRVFTFYGMTEKGAFAAECEHSSELHVDPLYGILELVDPVTGRIIEEAGVPGEIVVTSLISRSMPLLRYRTGDRASWAEGGCACGRQMRRLASIEGRWGREALISASGARISMSAINVHSGVFDRVRRFRFVQERPGFAELLVVPDDGYTPSDARAIEAEMAKKLAGRVQVTVTEVPEIALTLIGKQVLLDQRIEE